MSGDLDEPLASTEEKQDTVVAPTPERVIIHELCLLLGLVHDWGNESGALSAAPEWLARRYQWAVQQAKDSGAVQ